MLIGITGKKTSGKSTCASHLCRSHGFTQIAFADVVKTICARIFDIPEELFHGSEEDKNKETWVKWSSFSEDISKGREGVLTNRELLQTIGTDVFRSKYEDVWVDAALRKISKNKKTNYVISDVRFDNEAQRIRDNGGLILRVNRSSEIEDNHASEKGISDELVDLDLNNDSTLEVLKESLTSILVEAQVLPRIPQSEQEDPYTEVDLPREVSDVIRIHLGSGNATESTAFEYHSRVCVRAVTAGLHDCIQVATLLGEVEEGYQYQEAHSFIIVDHSDLEGDHVKVQKGSLDMLKSDTIIVTGLTEDYSKCFICGALKISDYLEAVSNGSKNDNCVRIPKSFFRPIRELIQDVHSICGT